MASTPGAAWAPPPAPNPGFVKAERLDGNIGYLRIDGFLPPEECGPRAASAMTFLADTDALILDARENHGGDPASVGTSTAAATTPASSWAPCRRARVSVSRSLTLVRARSNCRACRV
jgi:hypothetical protein